MVLRPPGEEHKTWYLAGRVVCMGYLNSGGIAQHIHRAVVQKAIGSMKELGLTIQEPGEIDVSVFFPICFDSIWITSTNCRSWIEKLRLLWPERLLKWWNS